MKFAVEYHRVAYPLRILRSRRLVNLENLTALCNLLGLLFVTVEAGRGPIDADADDAIALTAPWAAFSLMWALTPEP